MTLLNKEMAAFGWFFSINDIAWYSKSSESSFDPNNLIFSLKMISVMKV
jgi:hypothetical protein